MRAKRYICIITGISRGLGKFLVIELSKSKKNTVSIIGISRKLDRKLAAFIKKYSFISWKRLNLSDINKVLKFSYHIRSIVKHADGFIFINNAATIEPIAYVHELNLREVLRGININLVSSFIIIRELIKISYSKAKRLLILNISSGVAFDPLEGWGIYSFSKSAMENLIRLLNKEFKRLAMDAKAISFDPGVLDTRMQSYIRKQNRFSWQNRFINYMRNGKLRNPREAARSIIAQFIIPYLNEKL